MNVLFMIGRGDEPPSIIDDLLDIEKVPSRPEYDYAPGENLILSDCGFEDMHWKEGSVYASHESFNLFKVRYYSFLLWNIIETIWRKVNWIMHFEIFDGLFLKIVCFKLKNGIGIWWKNFLVESLIFCFWQNDSICISFCFNTRKEN